MREPPHLSAGQRLIRHQPAIAQTQAPRLVEIFADHRGSRKATAVVLDHDGRRAFGRHQQELPPPVPHFFFDQTRLDSHLAKHEADEPGMGAERVMVKRDHQIRA